MTETSFIGAEEQFSSSDNDPISFRLIVLFHMRTLTQLCNTEWHGGYWNERTKVSGGQSWSEKFYVENSRDKFWNSVHCLYDICYPYFDDTMKKKGEKYQEEIDNIYSEYMKTSRTTKDKVVYWDSTMKVARALFRELSAFLKRRDYFKGIVLED